MLTNLMICLLGSHHYSDQSCPVGYVCPQGSSEPVPCPPGSYGNRTGAESLEECHKCPPGTFNHLYAQRACFPCGSSSTSDAGQTVFCQAFGDIHTEHVFDSKSQDPG